jgi:2-polyprenyl-6-methoxyphenol hydroxylase-like FAD-dependent oxidoreductase
MRFVVVGAGPAGAALTLVLARAGVDVRLLDREAAFDRVFRGEGLMPLGLDALAQLDPGWSIDVIPGRVIDSWRIHIDGEEVLRIPEPVAELGDRAFRVASPAALLDRLVTAAAREPSCSFHPGVRCADLERDAGGRVVGVRVVTGAGEEAWPADLVVGCDGRGSSVRTKAGLALDRAPEQYDVLWCKLPTFEPPARHTAFRIMVRAGAHPLLSYTSWDDLLQLGVVMPRVRASASEPAGGESTGGLDVPDGADWLRHALRAAPPWLVDHVLGHRDAIVGPTRLHVLVGRAPSWTAPGVLLLGDAAHPMSPVRAQGINLALRDAVVAANHLVPLGRRPVERDAVDAACRAVQAEREPEVVRAQQLQRREAAGQGDARAGSWRYALARRGARTLGGFRWAQRAWLARQRELRFGSTTVELTV